jgi:hypothetical protein
MYYHHPPPTTSNPWSGMAYTTNAYTLTQAPETFHHMTSSNPAQSLAPPPAYVPLAMQKLFTVTSMNPMFGYAETKLSVEIQLFTLDPGLVASIWFNDLAIETIVHRRSPTAWTLETSVPPRPTNGMQGCPVRVIIISSRRVVGDERCGVFTYMDARESHSSFRCEPSLISRLIPQLPSRRLYHPKKSPRPPRPPSA